MTATEIQRVPGERRQSPKVMLGPIAIPYEHLSGLDIAAVSPAGDIHRYCSLPPNRRTELLDLQQGTWVVHNDSPYILRLDACSENKSFHIRTLCPSENWSFNWPGDQLTLTATLQISAQVFHLPSMDSGTYRQRASTLKLKKWEYLFYQYMIAARTSCRRVPEGTSPTPDFTIALAEKIVPIELKEFSRNEQERKDARLLSSRGYSEVTSDEIGHRLAKAVNSSRSQLRSFLEQHGNGPAILGVIDPCGLRHGDPENIAAVLEGHIVIHIATRDGSHIGTSRKENRRRAPYARNEILSAIAVLSLATKEGSALDSGTQANYENIVANLLVYHNPHAKQPISPRVFGRFGFPPILSRLHSPFCRAGICVVLGVNSVMRNPNRHPYSVENNSIINSLYLSYTRNARF